MRPVIDASVALAWCFRDETTARTNALYESVRQYGALVPALWHLEMANVLLQAERRGRLTRADLADRLKLLSDLPIVVDGETLTRAWHEILLIARSEKLTTYDAAYLELAIRASADLATTDKELALAATRAGVKLLI